MQAGAISSYAGSAQAAAGAFTPAVINGRPDFELAAALQQVSPKAQSKAQATATDFEAMFLNSMFANMTSGLKGDGPFGDTVGTGVWRSMLTEQYSRGFAKAGGVGIASEVYRTLILQQAKISSGGATASPGVRDASPSAATPGS